jgi:hypothetical protein
MRGKRWVLGLCITLSAHAAGYGTIAGTVNDQDGRPVSHGRIRVVDVVTGKQVTTGGVREDHAYAFSTVPEGSYYLEVKAPGYELLITKTVIVKAGEIAPLDLVLQTHASRWFTSATAIWAVFASLILAISTPWIHRLLYRPSLALEVRPEPPYCHWISPQFTTISGEDHEHKAKQSGGGEQIQIYFARIVIRNKGRVEAEQVEVDVRQVYQERKNWEPMGRFVPLNLRWSNTWDILKAGEDVPGESRILTKDRISEGGERLCDLGFIVESKRYGEFCKRIRLRDRPRNPSPDHDQEPRFHLAFEFIRDVDRHRLSPGRYILEVVVDALRVRPKSFWLELMIPAEVQGPKNENDRRRGLPGFEVRCHQFAPPGVPITAAPCSRWKRYLRRFLGQFQAPIQHK